MIDAHAHLDHYGEALPRALTQIREQSILTVSVSMDVDSFQETLRISELEPLVLASFGIHPWEAPRYSGDLSRLDSLLELSPLIGEIGLDHYFVKDTEHYPAQNRVFAYFLDAAENQGKIVNIHTKGAEAAVLEHLGARSLPGIILHWYSGPSKLVEDFLKLGAYFTVGVEVFRSSRIQELARTIPVDRLLTETDNPGAWEWLEGEIGYPDLLNEVELTVARIRGMERAELSEQVAENLSGLLSRGGLTLPTWDDGHSSVGR